MDPQTFLILFALILLVAFLLLRGGSRKPSSEVERVIHQPHKHTRAAVSAIGNQVADSAERKQADSPGDGAPVPAAADGWRPLGRDELEVETLWRLEHAIRDMPEIGREQMMRVDFNLEPKELAGVLASNPFYAGKILKIVNSAAIGLRTRIDSLQRAITYLGYNQVKNIVFQHMVNQGLPSQSTQSGARLDLLRFWKHSHAVSICADYLLRDVIGKPQQIGVVTTAALLHDIGWVVFDRYDSVRAAALYERLSDEEPEPMKVEQELFGFNHLIAGSLLAGQWEIPHSICEMIELHHCGAFGLESGVGRDLALGACVIAKAEQFSAGLGFANPLAEPIGPGVDLSPVIGARAAALESAPMKLKGEVEKTMKFIEEFNRN